MTFTEADVGKRVRLENGLVALITKFNPENQRVWIDGKLFLCGGWHYRYGKILEIID
jgi:hypothetical protein